MLIASSLYPWDWRGLKSLRLLVPVGLPRTNSFQLPVSLGDCRGLGHFGFWYHWFWQGPFKFAWDCRKLQSFQPQPGKGFLIAALGNLETGEVSVIRLLVPLRLTRTRSLKLLVPMRMARTRCSSWYPLTWSWYQYWRVVDCVSKVAAVTLVL